MLRITVPKMEFFDEAKQEFIYTKETKLALEHSLVSISKWEAIYCKPFLDDEYDRHPKTNEEILKYIECMTITQNVDPLIYKTLPPEVLQQIKDYISSPMTATTFAEYGEPKHAPNHRMTSELIYFYMSAYNLPFDVCEKWPIQRLLTLIRICGIKNSPPKKMASGDILSRNKALNEARRMQLKTKG